MGAYEVVAGDPGSLLRVSVIDNTTKAALDLSGKTIKLLYKLNGGPLVTRTMTLVTPPSTGKAEYQFTAGDLSAAGVLECRIRVNEGLADQLTSLNAVELRVAAGPA